MRELLHSINRSLDALNAYVAKNQFSLDEWPYKEVLMVLTLFKNKITHEGQLETRLLRSMKDIYVVAFRNFEGTLLYEEINNVDNQLRMLLNNYDQLEPLGMDFGKGDPI